MQSENDSDVSWHECDTFSPRGAAIQLFESRSGTDGVYLGMEYYRVKVEAGCGDAVVL